MRRKQETHELKLKIHDVWENGFERFVVCVIFWVVVHNYKINSSGKEEQKVKGVKLTSKDMFEKIHNRSFILIIFEMLTFGIRH